VEGRRERQGHALQSNPKASKAAKTAAASALSQTPKRGKK
jgi:hypothetical protein